jgi:hypothetical protein
MKKSVVAMLVMIFASLVVAQNAKTSPSQKSRPDLSGRWTLDFSEDSKGKSVKATKVIVLVVKHQEPEIKFLENAGEEKEQELNYYTDGRGEENPSGISIRTGTQSDNSAQENEKLKSKTKWDGERLVAQANLQRTVNGHTYRMDIVKEWKLSKDGNILTITLRTTNLNPNAGMRSPSSGAGIMLPARPSETKKVYRRDTMDGSK